MRGGKDGGLSVAQKSTVFILLIAAAMLFGVIVWQISKHDSKSTIESISFEKIETIRPMPIDLATQAAVNWSRMASLSKVEQLEARWNFIFISAEKKNLGFEVVVQDGAVLSTSEVAYVGTGGNYAENNLTREQAIKEMRAIKGYENEPVLSAEMIYGPDGQQWYWGLKTNKGVVTIPSKR